MPSVACYRYNPSYVDLFGSSTTSTLILHRIDEEYPILPNENYKLDIDASLFRPEGQVYMGVEIISGYKERSNINIIQNFALKMIESTKDIDPVFAKIAKDYFWDLI